MACPGAAGLAAAEDKLLTSELATRPRVEAEAAGSFTREVGSL